MTSPLDFFRHIQRQDWGEEALSFLVGGGWCAAFFITIGVFLTQYLVIGGSLFEKVAPHEILYVLPAVIVLGLTFFMMTYILVGAAVVGFVVVLFGILGIILYGAVKLIAKKGILGDSLKASFYSSAVIQAAIAITAVAVLVKFRVVDFNYFLVAENIIYILAVIYMWGLQSIGCRRAHDTTRFLSIIAASIPFIIAVLINWGFNVAVLPKFAPWLS
ncbi:MAG: hypothetical protein V1843_02405 [bacterium]